MNYYRISAALLVLFFLSCNLGLAQEPEKPWKAAAASVVITPQKSLWMAGYASRTKPSEGKVHDLHAKALAIEDAEGTRLVIVTLDLIGVPRNLRDRVVAEVGRVHKLPPEGLLLNASHTHCGPVLRSGGSVLYGLTPEQDRDIAEYLVTLEKNLVDLVGKALKDLTPARLSYTHARAGFAMNRRLPSEKGYQNSPYPDGPVDQSVPVLRVEDTEGKLKAVLFGYACHNTTLSFQQFCGDYAGFAQQYIEEARPGVTALFMMGCGGDQNPYPRGNLDLAKQHGQTLANSVEAALLPKAKPIRGKLQSLYQEVRLAFVPLNRDELLKMKESSDQYDQRRAKVLLEELEKTGQLSSSYMYPVQVVQLGDRLTLVALAGETVVDYALRLKKEAGDNTLWVAGYSNDVFGYVPSLRVLKEGGYEGGGAMKYTQLPGVFASSVEDRIVGKVHEMVKKVRPVPVVPVYKEHQDLTYYLEEGSKYPVKTVLDWETRRKHILGGMQMVMGQLLDRESRVALEMKVVEEVKVEKLIRRTITYQSASGERVPAYLFIPPWEGKRRAAVLCLQQTTNAGKDETAGLRGDVSMHYGLQLAQRGFVTLVPDYPSFGEHKWDFDPKKGYASGTMKAVWDNIRGVDLLQSLPEVDGERIGCIGHSLGGHNAMFTAAFEPRLKAIVSSCGFTRFHKDDMPSWTGPRYMPRIASVYKNNADLVPFDFTEIIGAFAPRPFLACAAIKDDDFDVEGVREAMKSAKVVYDLFDRSDVLEAYYPDCKHSFPEDARKKAYEFLANHLREK